MKLGLGFISDGQLRFEFDEFLMAGEVFGEFGLEEGHWPQVAAHTDTNIF